MSTRSQKKNKKKKPRNLFPKSSFSRISCQTSRRIRAVRPEVSWPSSFLASWLVCVSVSEMYHFTNINVNYGGIAARLIIRDRLSLPYIDSIPRLVGVSLLKYLHVHVIHDSDKNTFHTLLQIFNQR